MIYKDNLSKNILLDPISEGADALKIVTAYAKPSMVSWHLKEIAEKLSTTIHINLLIGMTNCDGIELSDHQNYINLCADNDNFNCQYVSEGPSVHSKLYIWEKKGKPFKAFMGSANYTQTAFHSKNRSEILCQCDSEIARQYYDAIEKNTIRCNHSEVEEHIALIKSSNITYENNHIVFKNNEFPKVELSFLKANGEIGETSGLNWGQRLGREPNQAYIRVPSEIAQSGFFPINGTHFSVLTDDKKHLIFRLEQVNNKAMTTPMNNSLVGEYFRNRLGLANGAFVNKSDLLNYGRTDVTFYQLDEDNYFMDFSVE